jgi:hypothetical protein
MLNSLSAAGAKVQAIFSQANSKIQATLSSSIEKIKACVKTIFTMCVNAQARICGLGQAGRKAAVLLAGVSTSKLNETLDKTPQLQETAKEEATKTVVVEENTPTPVPTPVPSKMERVKQAVKDGSAFVAKTSKEHPYLATAVIAAGMFGLGKMFQATFSSTQPDHRVLQEKSSSTQSVSTEEDLGLAGWNDKIMENRFAEYALLMAAKAAAGSEPPTSAGNLI